MAKRTPESKQLALGDQSALGIVRVDLEAFFEFSFWIAEEVTDLISLQAQRYPRRKFPMNNSLSADRQRRNMK